MSWRGTSTGKDARGTGWCLDHRHSQRLVDGELLANPSGAHNQQRIIGAGSQKVIFIQYYQYRKRVDFVYREV